MEQDSFQPTYKSDHAHRHQLSLDFIHQFIRQEEKILDLGPVNPLSEKIINAGYQLQNTSVQTDLDLDYSPVLNSDYQVLTAFEILEHLVSPFPLLQQSAQNKLIASVPLKLWFSKAYWNSTDPFDRHYHEFEPRQFDMLLEKAGWKIIQRRYLKSKVFKPGIRPILRNFYPRIYLVFCIRA